MKVHEFIGVYDADAGARGEVTYVIGSLLGRAHCSLCDITHSPVRRKRAWDAMVAELPVPFVLLHRNEVSADVAAAIVDVPLATVLARTDQGVSVVIDAPTLAEIDGDVERFTEQLHAQLEARGWTLS